MLLERVKHVPGLFVPKYDPIDLMHFFIKRMNFSPSEFLRLSLSDRTTLFELEERVIEEENKNSESS